MSVICILLLMLCIAQGKNDAKIYTEDVLEKYETNETTHKLKVKKGDKFAIQLRSNPTTGYIWKLVNRDELNLLTPASKDGRGLFIPPIVEEGVMGAPGIEQYFFTPKEKGVEMVELEYKREWENHPLVVYKILIFSE